MTRKSICIEMVYEDRPLVDRIDRVAELGADTIEFWTWRDKDLDALERRVGEHGLDVAGFVGTDADLTAPGMREQAVADIAESVETAERLGAPNLIVLAGDERDDLDRDVQRENVVAVLRAAAAAAEEADVTLLLEPLNTAVDHPGYFLRSSSEGYEILRKVDSQHVKLLFDVYHQQITEGNIIANVTDHLDLIGHVHVADVPGRHEPGTGELNYDNILAAIDRAGYDGYVGFEFTPDANADEAIREILATE